jgi:hypothetical protein
MFILKFDSMFRRAHIHEIIHKAKYHNSKYQLSHHKTSLL